MKEIITLSPSKRARHVSYTGFVNSDQMNIIVRVLNDHCSENGIVDEGMRQNVAALLMSLFSAGAETAENLSAALAESTSSNERRSASAPVNVPYRP